jgi:hypothetical protein
MKKSLALVVTLVLLFCFGWAVHGLQPSVIADPKEVGSTQQPLLFPNNVNTIVQRDSFGISQNLAYYDSDSGLFLGPGSDPRTTILANVPVNLFRRHVFLDFEEATGIDPRCRVVTTGSAEYQTEMGLLRIQTGNRPHSSAELILPNVSAPAYAGQRIYFYLRTYPAGNLKLTFGLRHPSQENVFVGFSRTDSEGIDGRGGDYMARTANKEGTTEANTGVGAAVGGDGVRRLFCINITKTEDALNQLTGEVEFYVGSDGGVLEHKATLASHIPDVTDAYKSQHLVPFVRLENNAAVNQTLDIDVIYGVLVR